MLRYRELYDPVTRTKDMEVDNFLKYVEIRKQQSGPTNGKLVREIKKRFYDTHRQELGEEVLDEWWKFVRPMLEENEGLAQFTLDFGGAESKYFFPWLKEVKTSPSGALEMSYGYGPDLKGRWRSTEYDDNIDFFVRNDPTFVYNRERQLYVANLVTSLRDVRTVGKTKVVDLGAGRMAWMMHHGFQNQPSKQTIMAYDNDATINPEVVFGKDHSRLGLVYTKGDFMALNAIANNIGTDLFILQGVASYYPADLFQNAMVRPIHQSLKEGGVFFFDLQLDCPYYQRSVAVFGWPKLNLAKSPSAAIDTVEQMRKELWKNGVRFSAEYALDSYNEVPTSVMVTFTKL